MIKIPLKIAILPDNLKMEAVLRKNAIKSNEVQYVKKSLTMAI